MKVTFDAPDELVAELRRHAAAEDRSIAGELRAIVRAHTASRLDRFVVESNRIEGITGQPTQREIDAHAHFLTLPTIDVPDLERFVDVVAGAPLRDRPGDNVRVGPHVPPPGGPHIRELLDKLLQRIRLGELTPMRAHVDYETLHPFMDGNGRSGRVLWAWQTLRAGRDPFELGFLHAFYYQALNGLRR